jgi:hypothetical protein
MEELVSFLTTRLGSDEFLDQNILLSAHQSWRWRRGVSKKSRLIPIARWLQRRLVFLCRTNESDIRRYVTDNPMPQNYCTQAASNEDVYD